MTDSLKSEMRLMSDMLSGKLLRQTTVPDDTFGTDGLLHHETHPSVGGDIFRFCFPNDFGASVIRHIGSLGGPKGYWELAVLDFHYNDDGDLTYDTPITDDVCGYLTVQEVKELLGLIKAL